MKNVSSPKTFKRSQMATASTSPVSLSHAKSALAPRPLPPLEVNAQDQQGRSPLHTLIVDLKRHSVAAPQAVRARAASVEERTHLNSETKWT